MKAPLIFYINLLFSIFCLSEGIIFPIFIYEGLTKLLSKEFGKQAERVAFKTHEFIEKRAGVDISLGDLSGMNVEMVKVIEPFKSHVVVSTYIENRLVHAAGDLKSLFTQKKTSLKQFKEFIGFTIIMNETEAAAAEVLLSTRQCLLSPKDYYFKRIPDPCHDLSQESIKKIITRIEDAQKIIKSMKVIVDNAPAEWDNHLRHVVVKLDMFTGKVLNGKEMKRWTDIKEYIQNKRGVFIPPQSSPFMVILGFRPKVETSTMPSVKTFVRNKTANSTESVTVTATQTATATAKVSKPEIKKNVQKSKYNGNPNVSSVSSNWKRLKSLNTLTTKSSSSSSSSAPKKTVTDSEWFGVKDVSEFAAGSEDQILRENVSTATLFPPPPPGMSSEKLKQSSKYIALDCEMVGTGLKGFESILSRVSVVNFHGIELLDVYVKPTRKVIDYRTAVSGITPGHVTESRENSSLNMFGQPLLTLSELQNRLIPLLHERIVVGHALNNDFSALLLSSNHPRKLIRDTSRYTPFRALSNGRSPSLKMLAAKILGVKIQSNEHDSVDDARIAMLLYRAVKSQWENAIFTRQIKNVSTNKKKSRRHLEDKDEEEENNTDNINSNNSENHFIFDPNL